MFERDLNPDLLPASYAEVAQVIGLRAALVLVERYGGTRLYVPQDSLRDWSVIDLIGERAAQRLIARYRLDCIWVPRCVRAVRAARDAELRARHAKGEKADALAREYGLTDRAVWYIVGRVDPVDTSQLPLI